MGKEQFIGHKAVLNIVYAVWAGKWADSVQMVGIFFSDFPVVEIEHDKRSRVVSGDVQVAKDSPASLLVYRTYAFNLRLIRKIQY